MKVDQEAIDRVNRSLGKDCLICGAYTNHEVLLLGLYATRICLYHSNAFHEHVIKRGWLRTVHRLEKLRDAYVVGYRGLVHQKDSVIESTREVDMYRDKMYYECKKWVNEKKMEVSRARAEAVEPSGKYPVFDGEK